ncbi:MAG: hypothetical protein WBA57_17280 [Elainellaceae cyanobacterium]
MDIILLIAACVISYLVFAWLINVVKATAKTAVAIALLVLVIQILFGIGPSDIMQTLANLWGGIVRFLTGQP